MYCMYVLYVYVWCVYECMGVCVYAGLVKALCVTCGLPEPPT